MSVCLTICGLVSATTATAFDAPTAPTIAQGTVQVAFAPWDDVEAELLQLIDGATNQIRLQAYLLTSRKIADALIAAKQRGIDVQILADETQSGLKSAKIAMVAAAGISVWLETRYQNAHNKLLLIDATTAHSVVVTGSFNFTWTAQHRNAENILVTRNNPALAARYASNWQRHQAQAKPYVRSAPASLSFIP